MSPTDTMNMSNPLVPGTIQAIYDKGSGAVESPYVQIIHLKSFEKESTSTRYKYNQYLDLVLVLIA